MLTFFGIFGAALFIWFLIVYMVYHERINQEVETFFENRNAQKIAKKLDLIDKGLIPVTFIKKPHTKNEYEEEVTVHTFCGHRARIGLLGKESVKWCPTCERVLSEGGDDDDDDDGKKPSAPLTPVDPKELTRNTIEKAKKKEVHSA